MSNKGGLETTLYSKLPWAIWGKGGGGGQRVFKDRKER